MTRRHFEECVAVVVGNIIGGAICIALAAALGAHP